MVALVRTFDSIDYPNYGNILMIKWYWPLSLNLNLAGYDEDQAGILPFLQFCGGSLVSSKHVVTAAHCVFEASPSLADATENPLKASDILVRMSMIATEKVNINDFFQIRIGDHDFNQMDETQIEENTIKVAKITVHPKYGKS